jgi:aryl-alcohol dehydrogenase-like predicted oxidoreductase
MDMMHGDTAEMYSDGHEEELPAGVIALQHDRVFLVSKLRGLYYYTVY